MMNRIAELRKERGLTQEALASAVGGHWITISKIERGEMQLTQKWMGKIAEVLAVQPADLLPGADASSDNQARLAAASAVREWSDGGMDIFTARKVADAAVDAYLKSAKSAAN